MFDVIIVMCTIKFDMYCVVFTICPYAHVRFIVGPH